MQMHKFRFLTVLTCFVAISFGTTNVLGEPGKNKKSSASKSLSLEAAPVQNFGPDTPKEGKVVDVIKGDELVLENGWVVRMIGIDVPTADFGKRDGKFYGKAAIDLVKKLALGKTVKLVYDQQSMDAYDRLLAYVDIGGKESLNFQLVKKGLALAACYPPNTARCGKFSEAQRVAIRTKLGLWNFNPEDWPKAKKSDNQLEGIIVRKVIDGDTIQLEDGTIVRYIGIDAPESEMSWKKGSFGYDAYQANRELVEGQKVTLEYDVEYSDPRGRELAYVYVEHKGKKVMANYYLVANGVAWVAVFPPNIRHIRDLFEAQEQAFKNKQGIWKK